jgi:hypothetical protein
MKRYYKLFLFSATLASAQDKKKNQNLKLLKLHADNVSLGWKDTVVN